jgi:hypothetical protein
MNPEPKNLLTMRRVYKVYVVAASEATVAHEPGDEQDRKSPER